MKIVGIDFSTDPKKCGIAFGEVKDQVCTLKEAFCLNDEELIVKKIQEFIKSNSALIAIDAPLGWPASMGKILCDHTAGEKISTEADKLFSRITDRFVRKKTGKKPLDVGADKIARTAHGALNFIHEIYHNISLAGKPGYFDDKTYAIEVYPAVTLIQHKILKVGSMAAKSKFPSYKGKEEANKKERKRIIDKLTYAYSDVVFDCWQEGNEVCNDHILDAVICVLAGFDFLKSDVYHLKNLTVGNLNTIKKEGWIWFKKNKSIA